MSIALYRVLARWIYPWLWQKRLAQGKINPERAAEYRGDYAQKRPQGKLLWFHAASVGESLSLIALMKVVHQQYPDWRMLLTSGTRGSAEAMAQYAGAHYIHVHAPLDHPDWVRRFLTHWQPDVACWVESDLWPILLCEVDSKGIPRILLNGRISARSFRWYRWFPATIQQLLGNFSAICVQNMHQLQYFRILGVYHARVGVNLKDSAAPLVYDQALWQRWQQATQQRRLWVAASTHPGEEEIIAQAQVMLQQEYPDALCILIPRHTERSAAIAETISHHTALTVSIGTEPAAEQGSIHIIDSLGMLGVFYRLSSVAFVGGSLVPIGGHNLREPALLSCGLISGKYLHAFPEQQQYYAPVLQLVENAADLAEKVGQYWFDLGYAQRMQRQAKDLAVRTTQQAIDDNMRVLDPFLQQK